MKLRFPVTWFSSIFQCNHVEASGSRHLHTVRYGARQLCSRNCNRLVRSYQRCRIQVCHSSHLFPVDRTRGTHLVKKSGDLILEANHRSGGGKQHHGKQGKETQGTVQVVPKSRAPPASADPHSLDRPPEIQAGEQRNHCRKRTPFQDYRTKISHRQPHVHRADSAQKGLPPATHPEDRSCVLIDGNDPSRQDHPRRKAWVGRRQVSNNLFARKRLRNGIADLDEGKRSPTGLNLGNIAMTQAVEFRLKRNDAAGYSKQRDKSSRNNPNGKVNAENPLAHDGSILRRFWQGDYSLPTPSESATRLM